MPAFRCAVSVAAAFSQSAGFDVSGLIPSLIMPKFPMSWMSDIMPTWPL